ncbi:hypothetical protein SLEP1_g34507 [Rubroshorea leprosula]|uniref:Uncharacterized protein n=1 Tax=Rubroshorea leprosula TaxID=152421 RepID=A0AAV5KK58_9ROSI|nr:hypothetical protein SLEP1_g34507 [Rubroshorea leprosula]
MSRINLRKAACIQEGGKGDGRIRRAEGCGSIERGVVSMYEEDLNGESTSMWVEDCG